MRPVALVALALLAAPATAQADQTLAGTAVARNVPRNPMVTLVRRDNGRVNARVAFPYRCHGVSNSNLVARLTGRINGAAFSASGSTTLNGIPRMRFTLSGTFTADGGATGRIRLRVRGCRGYTRSLLFRPESAPAGATTRPAPGSLLIGLGAQAAGGVRLPVILRVTKQGRVYGSWNVSLDCGRGHITRANVTPSTTIRPDGTFSRSETYTIPYRSGRRERYRVTFSGRFLTDGAVGTMRMTVTEKGFKPCRSGTVAWAAR